MGGEPLACFLSLALPKELPQQWVDAFYDQFVDRVADGRHLPRARVDELGRGRVWTGRQALDRGLVDKMGGLRDAIQAAKVRAGIAPDEPVSLDDPGKGEVSFLPGLQVLLVKSVKRAGWLTARALLILLSTLGHIFQVSEGSVHSVEPPTLARHSV